MNIHTEKLRTLLEELIRIDSVNPSLSGKGNGESEIARYLGEYLKNLGLDVSYQEPGENRVNVIGFLKGTGGGRSPS